MELFACTDCGRDIYRDPESLDRQCMRCYREETGGLAVAGYFRIEDYETLGQGRTDASGRPDHRTEGTCVSLPDIPIPVGRDKRGRERYEYRPHTTADVPNRRAFLEAAKRAGLSPGDGGRYRTAGQR